MVIIYHFVFYLVLYYSDFTLFVLWPMVKITLKKVYSLLPLYQLNNRALLWVFFSLLDGLYGFIYVYIMQLTQTKASNTS